MARGTRPPPPGAKPTPGHRDEITPIAHYIAAEINTNAHSAYVKTIAKLNRLSAEECSTDLSESPLWQEILGLGISPEQCAAIQSSYLGAALLLWTLKVIVGGDWDHKHEISTRFHPRAVRKQHWHLYGDILYNYDIWSNLHYGYVGMAAGFSESMLLDGAGVEQIGSDLLNRTLPKRSAGVAGMRAWDHSGDRVAIEMGIRFYRTSPNRVHGEEIKREVLSSTHFLNTKQYGS